MLEAFREHQIVLAPMGTVFPISEEAWSELRPLLPSPPDAFDHQGGPLPPAFAWAQRWKGVLPMTGGYDGYLDTVRRICDVVDSDRPAPPLLATRLESLLGIKPTAARLRESLLRKVGIIDVQGGVCRTSPWTDRWRQTGDDRIIVALLHSRCRLVGELLMVAREPRSIDELLAIANQRYAMGWDTPAQIANRRGWLQSSGMITLDDDGRLRTTEKGLALLAELVLFDPGPTPVHVPEGPVGEAIPETPAPRVAHVEALIDEFRAASVESRVPDRFERAVRDAFAFLGFDAEWLGGPGRTDVLLAAQLGRDDSYRVIVDCKTSASGSVGDQQVDWMTLTEHRTRHEAQFAAVVAPTPTGSRLLERAAQQGVTIISVEQLAGLCRQHARTPLGLDDYRSLFVHAGVVETQAVGERAEEMQRVRCLAEAIRAAVAAHSVSFGRLSARDLLLILSNNPVAEGTTQDELQGLLETLASPLLRLLDGSPGEGYRVTAAPHVIGLRLRNLSQQMGDEAAGDRDDGAAE